LENCDEIKRVFQPTIIGQKSFGTKLNRRIVDINFGGPKPAIMALFSGLSQHLQNLVGQASKQ
jgi:hypothetical protein